MSLQGPSENQQTDSNFQKPATNHNDSTLSVWIFSNRQVELQCKLFLDFRSQNQPDEYFFHIKETNNLQSDIVLNQIDFIIPRQWKEYFELQDYASRIHFNIEIFDSFSKYPEILVFNNSVEEFIMRLPKIIFAFQKSLSNYNKAIDGLIPEIIPFCVTHNAKENLIHFYKEFKTFKNLLPIFDKTAFNSTLSILENADLENFKYYFLGLDFFEIDENSCEEVNYWENVSKYFCKNKENLINFCLTFDKLKSVLEENFYLSIQKTTAKFVFNLHYENENFLTSIVEKYNSISENTSSEKDSVDLLKPSFFREFIQSLKKSNKEKIKFSLIEFFWTYFENNITVFTYNFEDEDDCFKLIQKYLKNVDHKSSYFYYCSEYFCRLFDEVIEKKNSSKQRRIEKYFEKIYHMEESSFNEIFQFKNLREKISKLIKFYCSEYEVEEKIYIHFLKFQKYFDQCFMNKILCKNEKENLSKIFLNLFKIEINNCDDERILEKELKEVNESHPNLIITNLREIAKICKDIKKEKMLNKIFDILGIDLEKIEKTKEFDKFLDLFVNESIISDIYTFLLETEVKKQINKNNSRAKIKKRIEIAFENKKNWILVKIEKLWELFDNVDKSKLFKIDDVEAYIISIFEELDGDQIDDWIKTWKPKKKKEKEIKDIKNRLKEEFLKLGDGRFTVERFHKFKNNYKQSQKLKELHFSITKSYEIKIYSFEEFESAKDELEEKNKIIIKYCSKCYDFYEKKKETNFNDHLNKNKLVTEFVDHSKKLFQEINWKNFSNYIQMMDEEIDVIIQNKNQSSCLELLNSIFKKSREYHDLIEFIDQNYKQMSLNQITQKLNSYNIDIVRFLTFLSSKNAVYHQLISLVQNYPLVKKYLTLYKFVDSELKFRLSNSNEVSNFASKITSLNKETTKLQIFEEILNTLKNSFDDFSKIQKLMDKFDFWIGFEDSLKLLNELSGKFDRLKEFVTDFQEFEFTFQNIDDLENLSLFIERLRHENETEKNKNQDRRNLSSFEAHIDFLQTKYHIHSGIEESIKYLKRNNGQFKMFLKRSSDMAESSKQKISAILNESKCSFDLSKDCLEFQFEITNPNKFKTTYSYKALSEMRDTILRKRALDFNQKNKVNPSPCATKIVSEKFTEFDSFIEFFKNLESLNKKFIEMKNYGFRNGDNKITFEIVNSQYPRLIELIDQLNDTHKKLLEEISEVYKNNYLFTFLHNEMFSDFENSLKDEDYSIKKGHILRFMGFNDIVETKRRKNMIMQTFDQPFKFVKQLLESEEFCRLSSLNEKDILTSSKKVANNHLYSVKIPMINQKSTLYKTILGLSLEVNDRLPKQHNLLFCSSSTKMNRLESFVCRVFNCPNNQIFMIIRPELLPFDLQEKLIELLILSQKNERKAYLFVLFFSVEEQIESTFLLYILEHRKHVKQLLNENVYKKIMSNEKSMKIKEKVSLLITNSPLTGKSKWILNESKEFPNSKLIHLRLAGEIDIELVFSNLIELIDKDEMIIHIDIGPVNESSLKVLDELLFSLIFLKTMEGQNKVIVVPERTQFFIEFDSSKTQDLKNSLEFFQFEFRQIDQEQTLSQKYVQLSPIPGLFLKEKAANNLKKWKKKYLEEVIDFPQTAADLRNAEINVGLDSSKSNLALKKEYSFNFDFDLNLFPDIQIELNKFQKHEVLPIKMIYEKILHFLAYNYARCGVLHEPKKKENEFFLEPEIIPKDVGELIMKSARYLTGSSFESLRTQQFVQKNVFTNSYEKKTADANLAKRNEEAKSWGTNNTVFVTFHENFPILVYSDKKFIPESIFKQDESNLRFFNINECHANQNNSDSQSNQIHQKLFAELAHLNIRLNVCKFCDKCFTKYTQNDTGDCAHELTSAENFWNNNFYSEYVKNTYEKIPLHERKKIVTDKHKLDAFKSYLKNEHSSSFENKVENSIEELIRDIDNITQNVCVTCLKIRSDSIQNCRICKNELMTSEKYFEKNKNNEEFKKIGEKNEIKISEENMKNKWKGIIKNKEKEPRNPNNGITYRVFDSDKYQQFLLFMSRSMLKKYVLTTDNYTKILQIHVRAKSRLPIVLMGETGCGKTSLIRFFCNFVIDDRFDFFSMHAGISETDVLKRVKKFFEVCNSNLTRDCWMLFDEFNTSDAMGLIKTLMIDRRLGNEMAPLNAIFIATCNPFKVKREDIRQAQYVGLKKSVGMRRGENTALVYNVHPLPESLFYFTFDFGQLSEPDEKKYAEAILKNSIGKYQEESKLKEIVSICVEISQYLKSVFDLSSTSLRDLKRFEMVHEFLYFKYYPAMHPPTEQENPINNKDNTALILSVTLCYCFRVTEKEQKRKIMNIVNNVTGIPVDIFESTFETESQNLLEKFNLERDVFKNTVLRENVFSMFVCLLKKIPLIIIGKPGSSKSLSLQLIFEKLKGEKSQDSFFIQFDELAPIPYQGSEYSTSKGIETIFAKAEELLDNKNETVHRRIPVVVFDEIGLAELSKNNPLKVLHSKLEIEDVKVGFLGISNWYLDSSKMNRVLTVARKDPDMEQLKEVSISMCGICNQQIPENQKANKITQKIRRLYYSLADVYYIEKKRIEKKDETNQGLIGLRDFYNLIKQTTYNFNGELTKYNISAGLNLNLKFFLSAAIAIRRNFSYDEISANAMMDNLAKKMDLEITSEERDLIQKITIENLFTQNLADSRSRNLMLIPEKEDLHVQICETLEKSTGLIQNCKEKYRVLIGSRFQNDLNSEAYCIEVISEIIDYMNQDIKLVLYQLESVYTSLYDLFNQSFKKEGDKNFCRIVIGTISKGVYPVNDKFKVILFVTEELLKNTDEPLVNRFEKYWITDEILKNSKGEKELKKHQNKIKKLKQVFDFVLANRGENQRILNGKQILGNFNEYSFTKWNQQIEQSTTEYKEEQDPVLEELIRILIRNGSLSLSKFLYENQNLRNRMLYLEFFLERKSKSLLDLFVKFNKSGTKKRKLALIYTFSPIAENIKENISRIINPQNDQSNNSEKFNSNRKKEKSSDQNFSEILKKEKRSNEIVNKNQNFHKAENFETISSKQNLRNQNLNRDTTSVDNLENPNENNTKEKYESLKDFVIEEKTISTIQSEKELKEILNSFFIHDSSKVFILKIDSNIHYQHIFYLQHVLKNFINNYKENKTKYVILSVHYKQSKIATTKSFPVSSEWSEYFIDDLFNGLSKKYRKIMLDPLLTNAVKLSKERIKNEFDVMIEKIVLEKTIRELDEAYLDKLQKFFNDFTKEFGQELCDTMIEKVINAINNDAELNKQTVYSFMNNNPNYLKSEIFSSSIDSIIDRKFESKLKKLIDIFLDGGIIESLWFIKENDKTGLTIQKIIEIVEQTITGNTINKYIEEELPGKYDTVFFPYTRKEYKIIKKMERQEFDDPEEYLINVMYEKYLKDSFYLKNGYALDSFSNEQRGLILIDFVNLHLKISNSEPLDGTSALRVVGCLINEKSLDFCKLFIYNPDLVSNLFVVFTNFVEIMKDKTNDQIRDALNQTDKSNNHENNSQSKIHKESIKIIEKLLSISIKKDILLFHLKNQTNFKKLYFNLIQSLISLSEVSTHTFENYESLHFLLQVGNFNEEKPNQNFFIYQIVNANDELLNKMDIYHFPETIAKMRKIMKTCTDARLVEENLMTFEALYYQNQVKWNQKMKNKDILKLLFENVFKRIDESEEFSLLVNEMIKILIEECEFKQSVLNFLKNENDFAQNNDKNLGEWLENNLKKHPKRLPYLIIAILTPEMGNLGSHANPREFSEAFKKSLNVVNTLDNSSLEEKTNNSVFLNKTSIICIYLIQFVAIGLCDSDENYENNPLQSAIELLNAHLNKFKKSAIAIAIYICKQLKKNYECNNEELMLKLKDNKECWGRTLKSQIEQERATLISDSECYVFRADKQYEILTDCFRRIESTKGQTLQDCLEFMRQNADKNSLFAFYSLIINCCYNKNQENAQLKKYILDHFNSSNADWTRILGKQGYFFVAKILTNFDNKSKLSIVKDSTEEYVKRNTSVLFAFALIVSHKNQNTYFGSFLFSNTKNKFEVIKGSYLPGMIQSNTLDVYFMKELLQRLEHGWQNSRGYAGLQPLKKIWKCSSNCNYFFVFENCGQPNVQPQRTVCPLCKKFDIGAISDGNAFPHHRPFSKEEGEKQMNEYIQKHTNTYSKGFFNYNKSIDDLAGDGVNVSFMTTNILNFISNSLILVLNELQIVEDDIKVLNIGTNISENLHLKIEANFKKLTERFKTFNPVRLMNLIISKISVESERIGVIEQTDKYLEFERKLESDVFKSIFSSPDNFFAEYNLNIYKSTTKFESPDSIIDYIDGINRDNCAKYPLAYHLRVDNKYLAMEDLIERFKLHPYRNNFPVTDYIFSNLSQLKNLNLILNFKNFYEDFKKEFSGKITRKEAEDCVIKEKFIQKFRNEHYTKLKNFVSNWNKIVKNEMTVRHECETFRLKKIDLSSKLTQILPNRLRGDSGTEISHGIKHIVKIQNHLLSILRPRTQGIVVRHSWEHISKETLFSFDEEKKDVKKINRECLLTYIDYQKNGAPKLNFHKFEQVLCHHISNLKIFRDDETLVPYFDYQYETGRITVMLNECLILSDQKPLSDSLKKGIEGFLIEYNTKSKNCAFAEIFNFCQNFLLPRALFNLKADQNELIIDFIENSMSKRVSKNLNIKDCFNNIHLNQIFSFLLFVEVLLFRELAENKSDFSSRISTNPKDDEWTTTVGGSSIMTLIDIDSDWTLSEHWTPVSNAFKRLALRTTYNLDNIDHALDLYIRNDTLFDLEFENNLLDKFSINEKVKLKHCLLFFRSLESHFEEEKKQKQQVKIEEVNRPLVKKKAIVRNFHED